MAASRSLSMRKSVSAGKSIEKLEDYAVSRKPSLPPDGHHVPSLNSSPCTDQTADSRSAARRPYVASQCRIAG